MGQSAFVKGLQQTDGYSLGICGFVCRYGIRSFLTTLREPQLGQGRVDIIDSGRGEHPYP